MSKAIFLEPDPEGHRSIRHIHNCASLQLETYFSGEKGGMQLHSLIGNIRWSLPPFISRFQLVFSYRRLVKKKSQNVNSGWIISGLNSSKLVVLNMPGAV